MAEVRKGMRMGKLKANKVFTLSLILQIFITSCSSGLKQTGILHGDVTIGPLVPVVGPGVEEPTPGPEVFADRKVVIFDDQGRREIRQVDIQADGNYWVELEIGTYMVDINHLGIDHAKGLPTLVEIYEGQITILDIDIDTGIR
jgi:hypothetical protein